MKYLVDTKNSSYILDDEAMTWERAKTSERSGYVRTDGGQLTSFPEIKIGESLILLGPPFVENAVARIVMTSLVERITYPHVDSDSTQYYPGRCA